MDLEIGPTDPDRSDVQRLLSAHLAFAHAVTPPGHVHALGADALWASVITVFAARRNGRLLGIGALRQVDPSHGEVKSMHTDRSARGRGVGRAMLDHLLAEAERRGYRRVSLETGTTDAFGPARSLYVGRGFRRCPPFGEYTDNPHSICMTLMLGEANGRGGGGERAGGDDGRRSARADPEAVAHLRAADPVLAALIDADPGFRPRAWLADLPVLDAFGALVFQVAGQQLSVAATRRILDRLQATFGGHLPSPAELLASPSEVVRAAGLSARKVETLRTVAARFVDGTLSDRSLAAMDDGQVEEALTAISGIGRWTAHGFLIVALDRADVVLPGDLALRKAIRGAYRLDHLPSEAEVLALAEQWRPHRSLACAYLFSSSFRHERSTG